MEQSLIISFVFDILILVSCLFLVVLIMLHERNVDKLKTQIDYLESVCQQAVEVAERAEKRAEELNRKIQQEKTKSFFQGLNKGRKGN